MSMDRLLPLDAATADALLDGRGDGPPELVALLARATAPGHPVELAGEAFAVAHLRAARSVLTTPHPPATRRGFLTRGFSVKAVAAAAVAVLVVGGVAIAATVGTSPSGVDGSGRGAVGSAASAGGGAAATGPGGPGGAGGGPGTPSSGPHRSGGPNPAASPPAASLRGLCEAYEKAAKKNPGKALKKKAFATLIAAAGGEDKVPQFCADLLGDEATPRQDPQGQDPPGQATPGQDPQGQSPQGQDNAAGRPEPTPAAGPPGEG